MADASAVLRYDANGQLIVPPAAPPQEAAGVPRKSLSRGRGKQIADIRSVAARYVRHPVVRSLGLSERGWTAFFQAMIQIESGYRPGAVSSAGAIGLAQLTPATARALRVNAHDPLENLDGGARYLITQMDRFGSLELALAAYNAGPEAVTRFGGIPPYGETRSHVRKVMAAYQHLLSSI